MANDESVLEEVRRRVLSLPAATLAEVARAFGQSVFDDGLRVLKEQPGGSFRFVPIPPLLTPVLPDAEAASAAKALLEGVIAIARSIFQGLWEVSPLFQWPLFAGLTPLEKECIAAGWREAERVASARVDFLRDADGRLLALEVNTTIPAMQAYSDIVARGWLDHVAPAIGMRAEAIATAKASLPSNVDDLRRALLAQATETGAGKAGRWALLARANDSQDGELAAIARRWADAGIEPVRVTPEDFFEKGPFDLVYRHLFARRIPAGHRLEEVYRHPRKWALWNPVNGHLEIKGLLAMLSEAAAMETAHTAAVPAASLDAARRYLPWTRILARDAETTLPDGTRTNDLAAFVTAHPGSIVLKRSWDYGGRSVFLSDDFDGADEKTRVKLKEATGREIASWSEMVAFTLTDDKGPWIAQTRVHPARHTHLRVVDGAPVKADLVTDVSAFTGAGAAFHPSGLTARAASGPIVNIVAGGGMAPILPPGFRL